MTDGTNRLADLALWREWIATPEGNAREKLHDALENLRLDPDIAVSELCMGFLDFSLRIEPAGAFEANSVAELVEPLTAYFNKRRSQSGANARHAEHRSMKADVFSWLDTQKKFKGIEAAAMAITRQQPIAHTTGRDWYKEWKKLRSASTP
jgi:hypothetical protein